MKRKRKSCFYYSDAVLKSGYEAMAQINLGFAESGLQKEADEYLSYEKILTHDILMESDEFDD